jgi:tRNA(Ile)-lysidine synthase
MKESLVATITTFADKHTLLPHASTIVVGLSGGPDSVFLLHYLVSLRQQRALTLVAAHLDHGWRADSYKDAQFCQELCDRLGVPLIIEELAKAVPLKSAGSQEELGRRARRAFFERVRQQYNADAIAVAHHADDQQETFFIRLLRGASLTGLTGMKPRHGAYIRPLLEVAKADIVAWLDQHTIAYCIDATNALPTFLRNRIRLQVIPALRLCDTRFATTFARTMEQLHNTESFLHDLTRTTFERIVEYRAEVPYLNLDQYTHLHQIMQQRLLLYWLIQSKVPHTPTQHYFAELMRFIQQPGNGSHIIAPQWSIVKHNGFVSMHRHQPTVL